MTFHPLGHILVSASNDHTTRFWSRERPGDVTSVFSGGGEKPPEALDMSGQDDDEDLMVPGFSYDGGAAGGGGTGGGGGSWKWWGNEMDAATDQGAAGAAGDGYPSVPFSGDDGGNADDFIPGLGAGEHLNTTPQEDVWRRGPRRGR